MSGGLDFSGDCWDWIFLEFDDCDDGGVGGICV